LRNSFATVVQTSDRIIGAEKNGANMDLQSQAENESMRRTRSKLEAHREAILVLRRKHWTYRQIAQWLNEHGVPVTFPSVYRFCEQAIARRPRSNNPFPAIESAEEPASFPIATPPTTTKPKNQYRFNMDI